MSSVDPWREALPSGELVVDERLPLAERNRIYLMERVRPVPVWSVELAGGPLTALVEHRTFRIEDADGGLVAELSRHARAPLTDGATWAAHCTVAGESMVLEHRRDDDGQGVELAVLTGQPGRWYAGWAGSRVRGRRFVLGRGASPDTGAEVCSCEPAAEGRSLVRRGDGLRTSEHRVRWSEGALVGEVVAAELLLLTGVDAGVGSLVAHVADAARGWGALRHVVSGRGLPRYPTEDDPR